MLYRPASFREDDLQRLHEFIQQHSFATLVSSSDAAPLVSHLPLLLEPDSGEKGRLIGHMARANSHWESLEGRPVLAIFHGPHAYVSPSWYGERNVVPTWNYLVAHAAGAFELLESSEERLQVVEAYVRFYERGQSSPWSMAAPDAEWIEQLLDGIVAFQVAIDTLVGKWKLSQNHSSERRDRVVDALAGQDDANAQAVAEWMRRVDR